MPYSGYRAKAIPFFSASTTTVVKWLPTVLVASICGWGVNVWSSPRVASPIEAASAGIREIGREYPKGLASAYAAAWIDGATALESGRGVSDSLGEVERAWKAGRTSLFDEKVSPVFSRVVPEGQPEAATSYMDRATLAVLWREFAAGLVSGD